MKTNRKELNLSKDDFYVITVGRLIKRKSLQTLIQAIGIIKNKKIKLLIIGDGPEKEYLESVVTDCNVNDRVTFLGFLDDNDKYRYLKCADLFALTSLHEGFGIVFMEAMHIGLPIVCTNHGGQVDFLKQRENAILFNVGDVQKCADSIIELYKDEKLYKKLAANNKKKIRDFYAEHVASQYIDIFKELISR